jgi:hypothetical protein
MIGRGTVRSRYLKRGKMAEKCLKEDFFKLLYSTLLHLPPPSSTVSRDFGIEPRTLGTLALAFRRCNHLARSHSRSARSHPQLGFYISSNFLVDKRYRISFTETYFAVSPTVFRIIKYFFRIRFRGLVVLTYGSLGSGSRMQIFTDLAVSGSFPDIQWKKFFQIVNH